MTARFGFTWLHEARELETSYQVSDVFPVPAIESPTLYLLYEVSG
jgi:hypothetical protein